jgi:DnaJ family protein C protein 2
MEVLSNPEKRRQFDSVDEAIDDEDVPEPKDTTAENFYELWTPVFDREGRFSKAQPVPSLGGKDASKKDVESFYDFWYSLDSWRSFEYLDKDAPEGTDSCVYLRPPLSRTLARSLSSLTPTPSFQSR